MITKLEFKILEHLFENMVGEMAQGERLPPKYEDLNSSLCHPPRSQAQRCTPIILAKSQAQEEPEASLASLSSQLWALGSARETLPQKHKVDLGTANEVPYTSPEFEWN